MLGTGLAFQRPRAKPSALLVRHRLFGIPFPGETLTAKRAGTWFADGQPIPGQSGASYTVTVRDVGRAIRCGNSDPLTIWHPADEPAVYEAWVAWEGVLHDVSPDTAAADGQTVHDWKGIVRSVRARQVSGTAQPVFRSTGVSAGLPSIEFNGEQALGLFDHMDIFSGVPYRAIIFGANDVNLTGARSSHLMLFTSSTTGITLGVYTRSPVSGNAFEISARAGSSGTIYRIADAQKPGWFSRWSYVDGMQGEIGTQTNNDPITTGSIPVHTMPETEAISVVIGNADNMTGGFPGHLACLILLRGNVAPAPLSINRLRQYAGLCSGINLGLSIQ